MLSGFDLYLAYDEIRRRDLLLNLLQVTLPPEPLINKKLRVRAHALHRFLYASVKVGDMLHTGRSVGVRTRLVADEAAVVERGNLQPPNIRR